MKKIIFILFIFLLLSSFGYAATTESSFIKVNLLNQDPSPAKAGDVVTVRFGVENSGGANAENFQAQVVEEFPFAVSSGNGTQNFGTLYSYQTGKNQLNFEFELRVDKDALDGLRDLKLRYRHSGSDWIMATYKVDVSSQQFAQIAIDKSQVEPGKETEIKFTLSNTGNSPLKDISFSWNEANGYILPVYSDDTKYIRYLEVGTSTELSYTVIADVNAKPGLYKVDLVLKFFLANGSSTTVQTKAGIFIGGQTDFDVSFSEGSLGQTSLTIANSGNNPALSVAVRIPQQEGFVLSGSSSSIIGNLDKGDYTVVSFQLAQGNISRGNVQRQQNVSRTSPNALKVLIDYTDTTGQRRTIEKGVPIQYRGIPLSSANGARTQSTSKLYNSTWFVALLGIIIVVLGYMLFKRKKK